MKSYLVWVSSDAISKGFFITLINWVLVVFVLQFFGVISKEALPVFLYLTAIPGFLGALVHQILVWMKVSSVHNQSSSMHEAYLIRVLPTGEVSYGKAFWKNEGTLYTVYVPIPDHTEGNTFTQMSFVTVGETASSITKEFLLEIKVRPRPKAGLMADWLFLNEYYNSALIAKEKDGTLKDRLVFVDAWIGSQFERILSECEPCIRLMQNADQIRITAFNTQLNEILKNLRFSERLGLTGVTVTVTADTESPLSYSTRASV